MITTAPGSTYYRLHFAAYGEYFAWGTSATDAIAQARLDITAYHFRLNLEAPALGAAAARKAVYGEWDCGTENFLADGTHLAH